MMKTVDDYKQTDFEYALDDEEAALLKAMDDEAFKPVNTPERNTELQQAAANFNKLKRKSINIRIPEYNLERLRMHADRQGLPYQTLINSILQQYLEQHTPHENH